MAISESRDDTGLYAKSPGNNQRVAPINNRLQPGNSLDSLTTGAEPGCRVIGYERRAVGRCDRRWRADDSAAPPALVGLARSTAPMPSSPNAR